MNKEENKTISLLEKLDLNKISDPRYKWELDRLYAKRTKEARLDRVYMKMADALSSLSYAERAKVGCLIVNSSGQIVSQGYNGTPSGFDNTCEADGVTKHEVLHAESNAISKCAKWGGSTDGATLYVTMSPCYECAKLIIQAGIKRVVYKDLYRDESGIKLLEEADIEVNQCEICRPNEDVLHTMLCVNDDGTYVLFGVNFNDKLDKHNGIWLKNNKEKGIEIPEDAFRTGLQNLDPGETVDMNVNNKNNK